MKTLSTSVPKSPAHVFILKWISLPFILNLITLFPFLCIHLHTPHGPSWSYVQLKMLLPFSWFSYSSHPPISETSRRTQMRFRSQTPQELWPPCWDINRRDCGGTLRLPGEAIVGSWKWGKGRDSTVTRSCSHKYNVHVLSSASMHRREEVKQGKGTRFL